MDAAPRVLTEPAPRGERIAYGPEPEQFWERFRRGEPWLVWIHGGFWKPEYVLAHAGHACAALAAEGIPVLSLEYRRDHWRHALDDVSAGIAGAKVVPISLSERHGGRVIPLEHAGHYEPISPWSSEWPVVVRAIRELS